MTRLDMDKPAACAPAHEVPEVIADN